MKERAIDKIICLFFCSSILIFLLQRTIFFSRVFAYYDDIYALMALPLFAYRVINKPVVDVAFLSKLKIKNIIILLLFFLMCGLVGNVIYGYQELKYVLIDLWANTKFFLAILTTVFIFERITAQNKLSNILLLLLKIFTTMMFVFTIFEYGAAVFNSTFEYRFGIKSIKLFYEHYTYFAASMCFTGALIILFAKNRRDFLWAIVAFLLALVTLRTKIIISVLCIALLTYIAIFKRLNKTIRFITLAIIGAAFVGVSIIAFDTIIYYFVEIDNSARSALMNTGFEIMKNSFPIGSGFGTFGSSVSAINYSRVYCEYDICNVYGLTRDFPAFISDSFWPMIMGQTGLLGLCIYVILLIIVLNAITKIKIKKLWIVGMIGISYLLISSSSESAFVNSTGPMFAILISLPICYNVLIKKNKEVFGGICE